MFPVVQEAQVTPKDIDGTTRKMLTMPRAF